VPGHIAGDFAAAGGVTELDGIPEVERLGDGEGIGCIMIDVVSAIHLFGPSVTTTVMGTIR